VLTLDYETGGFMHCLFHNLTNKAAPSS